MLTERLLPIALASLLSALSVASCQRQPAPGTPPPAAPSDVLFDVVPESNGVAVQGAQVTLDGITKDCCPGGVTTWAKPIEQPTTHVTVTAPGYRTLEVDLDFHAGPLYRFALTRAVQSLHVCGPAICGEDGQPVTLAGADGFRLLEREFHGEDVDPVLAQLASKRFDYVRVLGMYQKDDQGRGIGSFHPTEREAYLAAIGRLADRMERHGLRLKLDLFADAQRIIPDVAAQRELYAQVGRVLDGRRNVLFAVGNEGGRRKNGWEPWDFEKPALSHVLVGRGSTMQDVLEIPQWDFFDVHPGRGDDWMRRSDCRDATTALKKPCFLDEPMGAAEVATGSRDNVPRHFEEAGFLYALHGSGGSFHSDQGIQAEMLTGVVERCAEAFVSGLKLVPTWAQLAPYARGGRGNHPVGDMPIEHLDADEGPTGCLRTFSKSNGSDAYVAAIECGAAWEPKPLPGWRVVEQWGERGELLHLVRP